MAPSPSGTDGPTRILGIDPGSVITGYGVIDMQGSTLVFVDSGRIRPKGESFHDRLREIFAHMGELVSQQLPNEIAIERVFMHRNADSALKLGHARAAALCATFADPLPIHEYAPREIKQAITGGGGAEKSQVQHMVARLLGLQGELQSDAADALAVAITHAHLRGRRALEARLGARRRR